MHHNRREEKLKNISDYTLKNRKRTLLCTRPFSRSVRRISHRCCVRVRLDFILVTNEKMDHFLTAGSQPISHAKARIPPKEVIVHTTDNLTSYRTFGHTAQKTRCASLCIHVSEPIRAPNMLRHANALRKQESFELTPVGTISQETTAGFREMRNV